MPACTSTRWATWASCPRRWPAFGIPQVPFTLETLRIIFPYALTMAAVGLLESMMTAQIVDDLTDTPSNKRREMKGQGIANVLTGFSAAWVAAR